MTKNIIISCVIVVGVVFWGYKMWGGKVDYDAPVDVSKVALSTTTPVGEFGDISTSPSADAQAQATQNTDTKAGTQADVQGSTQITNNTKHMVTIHTNHGDITIETYDADAPNTVKNFVTLAQKGFYNGVIFHRVIPGFMIQGGDPTGTGTGGPGYKFADELNPETPSYKAGYKKGVVAMANAGPNTNGSQFFIMNADYPLPNSYTIFGHVVSGQNVVDEIANVPRNSNDKPLTPVVMNTVEVK